ncbi:peptide N-acetyl-beta-D-glucosaminyl asparaginase amidase A-domain-containing protein [Lasiosphaeris hirsuta]|uniref:Peptide N-acetyl-beta-D-glucosaminyl asparaginase amidase A-domain-containing protein n=1 Tax=Lasiosphaeris hirsuta TaxID=260670 RepID=A0AA40DZQ5_9PEZI|nr:peptide N-acetyl-beta-D-glucosaminyl asparaginase amidase A-domain-containing protein [Lasiosphaeris hirsuta]
MLILSGAPTSCLHSGLGLFTGSDVDVSHTATSNHGVPALAVADAVASSHSIQSRSPATIEPVDVTTSAPTPARTVLQCFEVDQPVLLPDGAAESDGSSRTLDGYAEKPCTVLLMRRDFAWSYNDPFIGKYTPPSCKFNRVVLNFTSVSHGRQFDRLALMYFGDTEVWRTSTAEPTNPPGIAWTYLKDMTEYLYFWKSPQTIIFDLGNLIDDKYTGIFNTTMTAIFFNSDVDTATAPPSDLIIPISARQGANNAVSQFTVPRDNATNTVRDFPRNARRAVFSVSANGQGLEEFWWSNVLQSDIWTFNQTAGQLTGYSPFREVQVLIDGQLAGVDWPFPVIFTGGVSPGLHRPIASVEAFDLKEHEIDITPFLPLLCDGKPHTFTIRIAGINDVDASAVALTERVDESWYVTGKIFVWLDDAGSITTGGKPTIQAAPPVLTITRSILQTANGTNETLNYDTGVRRGLLISARVVTQRGADTVSWSQTLAYTNKGRVSGFGYNQLNDLVISGTDEATGFTSPPYKAAYRYPLFANSTYSVSDQGNLTLWAHVVQGKQVEVSGASVFPDGLEAFGGRARFVASAFKTQKEGVAGFYQSGDGKNSSGWGTADQTFRFGGVSKGGMLGSTPDVELYFRNVSAANGSVLYDFKRRWGAGKTEVITSEEAAGKGMADLGVEYAPVEGEAGKGALRVFMGRNDYKGEGRA